jgi:DNA excision repair protein ERCC-3
MAYLEYNRNSGGQFSGRGRGNGGAPPKEHHNLFKKFMGRK